MTSVIYQITLALNLLLGSGGSQESQQACPQNSFTVECGVVIIDTDEL